MVVMRRTALAIGGALLLVATGGLPTLAAAADSTSASISGANLGDLGAGIDSLIHFASSLLVKGGILALLVGGALFMIGHKRAMKLVIGALVALVIGMMAGPVGVGGATALQHLATLLPGAR